MMNRLLLGLALALGLAAVPSLAQRQAPRPPARAVDWTTRVAATPAGTHVMGNPAAAQKLVEYLSYTCPHCAHFSAESHDGLAGDVRSGRVSVELRPAVRDGLDLTAALLARCGGPGRVFANSRAIFAAQADWMAAGARYAQSSGAALDGMSRADAVKAMAQASGLYRLMQDQGHSPSALDACLADPAALATLTRLAEQAWRTDRIPGTPHVTLNGAVVPNHWAELAPRLARP